MQDNKIAEPSNSSWVSPCRWKKPDSSSLPCVDQVGSAKVDQIGLLQGCLKAPLSPRAQEISVFITPIHLYSYRVMAFGLRNAPAMFQRLNRVEADLSGWLFLLSSSVTLGRNTCRGSVYCLTGWCGHSEFGQVWMCQSYSYLLRQSGWAGGGSPCGGQSGIHQEFSITCNQKWIDALCWHGGVL